MAYAKGRVVVLLLGLCSLSACTASGPESESNTGPVSPPSSTVTSTDQPTTGGPLRTEPVALVVNIHRSPVRLSESLARRVVSRDVRSWGELDQPGGHIIVREGPRFLDAVESDPSVLAIVPASSLRPTVSAATVAGFDPLASPARYPLTTESDSDQPAVTTMTAVGDIMLGRRVGAATPDDPGAALKPLQDRLARTDLTVGNLESTLSMAGAPRQGDDSFAADPAVLDDLTAAGFDLVSLANNHTGDYGPRALKQTVRRIDHSALRRVGAGLDNEDAWAPVVIERNGVRFGFLAFNAIGETPRATRTSPGAAEIRMQPRTGPLDAGDLRRVSRSIADLSLRADVVIVLPHWGDQYTHTPVPDQRTVGRALIDAGADLVVGGHAHWVQGVQVRHGRLVVHSLGNFIFDMDFSVPTQEGFMLELTFWDDDLMAAHLQPYVIGADFAPRLPGGSRAGSILDDIWSASDVPFRR